MILILFGTMISYIEPKEFPTPFEGIWWALVTMSTTGYGDFVPKTFFGTYIRNDTNFDRSSIFNILFYEFISCCCKKAKCLY
ncbi:ion channel [Aeribacillus sp. SP014]